MLSSNTVYDCFRHELALLNTKSSDKDKFGKSNEKHAILKKAFPYEFMFTYTASANEWWNNDMTEFMKRTRPQ